MTSNHLPEFLPPPPSGLPTVEPPSGKHIVQMFLVPGLIVGVIVLGALALYRGFGGQRTPAEWIGKLRDPNPEVRWRTAADLAQVILRDKDLTANADFALQLAVLLDDALKSTADDEKALAERLAKFTDKEGLDQEWQKVRGQPAWKTLEPERNYITFLTASLGNFTVPVGVPLMVQMAEQTEGMEPRGLMTRRQKAVLALATLGEKLAKDYPNLLDLSKDVMLQQLEKAVEQKDLRKWAGPALEYVKKRRAGEADAMGLDIAFARIADPKTSDPFLRELVALALNFWTGTDAENQRMDRLLVTLTHDSGAGGELLTELSRENPDGFTTPNSVTALEVCYNANIALANRGSKLVRVDMLKDMLDEDYLNEHMKVRNKNGAESADAAGVLNTLITTLRAVDQLHRKQPTLDLTSLRPAIDKLADNKDKTVKTEAEQLRTLLDTK